jgi:hypothetical protein
VLLFAQNAAAWSGVRCSALSAEQRAEVGQSDDDGYDFTRVELVTVEVEVRASGSTSRGGDPMAEVEIDGHVNAVEVMKVLIDIGATSPQGVFVEWANSYGQVA